MSRCRWDVVNRGTNLVILKIGCIIVGRANSMGMAIAGQVIAGISYGAQPLVHAVPSEVLPRRVRPVAQAAVNVAAALGSVLGLLVGGALTRHNQSGFRIYWYINAGLFALAALLVALLYNPPPRELQVMLTQREKFASLDWLGFLMLSSGLVLFCMSLVWSQNPYPWSNAHILATFILGLILVLMLIVYESHFKKDGIFHHALFQRGRNFGVALGCVFAEGLVFFTCNNYFAFEVSTLYETDILIVGVRYSLCFIAFAISTCITGVYCSRMKSVRVPAVFAFTLFLAYCITMATATVNSSKAVWGYPILFGTGLGICLNALMTTAQLGTPPELIATASGLMISVRSLGGSVGLALYNAIFTHTLSTNLASKVPAAVLPLGLPPSSIGLFIIDMTSGQQDALSNIPGISGRIIQAGSDAVLDSFSVAFRYVWVTAGCFTFIALMAAFFIQDPKAEFNGHIDAPFEPERSLSPHEV